MAQQVLKARLTFANPVTLEDNASFDTYWEATGSNTTIDFTSGDTPTVQLTDFINTAASGATHPMGYYLSPDLVQTSNGVRIDYTDITNHLDGSPAGTPFRTDLFTLSSEPGSSALPAGVAICFGYRGAYGTDLEHGSAGTLPTDDSAIDQGAPTTHTGVVRPRARDRGRFYLGPLSTLVLGSNGGGPSSGFLTDANAQAQQLMTVHNEGLAAQFNMVQWSRRAASVKTIAFRYVDEGYATQRRRGDTTVNRVHSWVAVP